MRFVLVDNYDSFTFNLFQLLAELNEEAPLLLRNDDPVSWPKLRAQGYGAVVVSPGPGRPERPRDFGISALAIRDSGMAVLGVCLGHQGLCHLHGAPVVPAPVPMHGLASTVHHAQIDLFEGIPSPFSAIRYHSLMVGELPAALHALAWSEDGVLMSVRHVELPQWGVQFHPESISSEHGARLVRNFRDLALAASTRSRARLRGDDEQRLVRRQPIVRYRRLALSLDPEAVFGELYAEREAAFWLDSSAPGRGDGCVRFSFMGDDSGPLAEVLTYDVENRRVTIRTAAGTEQADGPLLTYLDHELRARHTTTRALPFAFNGGYVGCLGYELKAECGGDAAHAEAAPDAALLFADRFLAFDHEEGGVWLVALETHDAPAASWLEAMAARLTALATCANGSGGETAGRSRADGDGGRRAVEVEAAWPEDCAPRHDDERYLELIARCQEAITAGETYEVCLTNAVATDAPADPWQAYRRLRRLNPAPFAAFFRVPGLSVLSASPERFLRVEADGRVEAKPIKGTAPRGRSVDEDLAIRERLRASIKDRAENLMIVDLLRNDLGVVCEVGSVHVPVLFGVESFATVHQLVSTIHGRLARGRSALDVVRAAFPGGSMTGAPKRRTMEIVDELEAGPRGIYSGALGWLALGGAADLSIVIRTLVVTEQGASFGAGGAIVALSDPREELREVRLKARALVEALALARDEPAVEAARQMP